MMLASSNALKIFRNVYWLSHTQRDKKAGSWEDFYLMMYLKH